MTRKDEVMPTSPDNSFEPELLDLHLGRLSAAEANACRARIAADPGLAEQNEALAAVFQALDRWRAAPVPADLTTRIRARVAVAEQRPRLVRTTDDLTQAAEQSVGRVIRLGSLREIVAVAAMIVLMVGLGVPGALHMRDRSQRMGCSANLAMVGRGLQQYASSFSGGLPFVGWNSRMSWQPSSTPGVVTLPNRRHVYPLLREGYVREPRAFLCPARGDVPMPAEQVRQRSDFIESRNVSYAYFNMGGARPSLQDDPNLPILADDNPMFEDGVPLFDPLGLSHPENRNSHAHGGAGQNILTLDGHVKWTNSPNAGIDSDNIWTLQGVQTYTGREGPTTTTDAHLLR
jgi:hypothetical protein